jgi:hypothetical protein
MMDSKNEFFAKMLVDLKFVKRAEEHELLLSILENCYNRGRQDLKDELKEKLR